MSLKKRLSLSVVLMILAISMLSFGSVVPATIADEQGEPPIPPCVWGQPRFDEIYYSVIQEHQDTVEEMKMGNIDYIKQVPSMDMQADLLGHGFNLSYCSVCELCGFWFNCRDYDGTSGMINQPLNYSEFRTALHYLYGFDDKDSMLSAIYGPTMLALDVVVPYAQVEWCASNDPVPGGNPPIGGPTTPMPTSPAAALALLTGAGFEIKDGPDADGKNELYNPDGTIVRTIDVWYKVGDSLLKEFVETYIGGGHGTVGVNEQFKALGVEEGPGDIPCGGLTYPLKPVPIPCCTMILNMLYVHDFDVVYWCFETWLQCPLGRFPDWLYHLFHSNFAGDGVFKGYNYVGFRNATADDLLETIMFDLNRPAVEQAVYDLQYRMLYEWNAVIPIHTKIMVSAYGRGGGVGGACTRWLEDWTAIPTCCSDNHYTWCQMHWEDNPTGECDHVVRRLPQPPCWLHPWYSNTQEEWAFLDREYEGLIDIHPQTLEDEPFIACDWNVTYWSWPELGIEEGMRVTFWLKDDVYWKDGYKVTSEDIKANWDYLKKYAVPRYATMWEHLVYCETEGPYKVSAYIDATSLWLLYHFAKTALFFPKWVLHNLDKAIADPADPWGIEGPQDFWPTEICYCEFADYCGVEYGPWIDPVNCIPYCVPEGKWEGGCYKMLIGTGQYYFDYWDPATETGHMVKNTCYWAGESELFCNIDASGDPDRPTGMELYERTLYHQENDTSALFEIQVRNLCGHTIEHLYVTATLDGEPFDTKGPFILDPWTHICVQFESPVVDKCLHVLDQIVTVCGPPGVGEVCCTGDKYVWWTRYVAKKDAWPDIAGMSIADIMALFLVPEVTALQIEKLPDCMVDLCDVAAAARAFGSCPGHPRWNPAADVIKDFQINMPDIACIAREFGWCRSPPGPWPQPQPVHLVAETWGKTVVCLNYNLTVDIRIVNVTNLWAYDIRIDYNSTLLELVEGYVISPFAGAVVEIEDYIAITALGGIPPFTGNATIAKLIFTAKMMGNATIDPTPSDLISSSPVGHIPFTAIPAEVQISKTGDITGGTANPLDYVPDGKVDMQDVATVARGCWADRVTDPESPKYGEYWHSPDIIPPCNMCPHSPNCDINDDGKIDTQDVAITSRHAVD